MFSGFTGKIGLNENLWGFPKFSTRLVEFLKKIFSLHGVDPVKVVHGGARFVRLQVSDEVPCNW